MLDSPGPRVPTDMPNKAWESQIFSRRPSSTRTHGHSCNVKGLIGSESDTIQTALITYYSVSICTFTILIPDVQDRRYSQVNICTGSPPPQFISHDRPVQLLARSCLDGTAFNDEAPRAVL